MFPPLKTAIFSILEIAGIAGFFWLIFSGIPALIVCLKRRILFWKLDRFCKKMEYEMVWNQKEPFWSLSPKSGFDFSIRAEGKTYHVLLVSGRYRYSEYSFLSPTELAIFRKISLNLLSRGRGMRGMGRLNVVEFGLNRKSLTVDLESVVPKGENKILLFYPVAKDVTWIAPGKGKVYLGNGDLLFYDYRFFTRSGFFDELKSPGKHLRWKDPWKYE